jgi:glycosyltransferase involved in cell wall biosynthesis
MLMEPDGSRVRLCFAVDAPYAGGAERYISLIANGVDRRTFEPLVLARRTAGLDAWARALLSSGVEVVRVPMELPFRPRHALLVLAGLRRIAPHIVHVNMPGPYDGQMGLLAPLSRLAGSAGVVVTEHLPRVEWLRKRAMVKRLSYAWVDRVLTVCRANETYLTGRQRVPAHKVGVVYNGIPATYGRAGEASREDTRRKLGLAPGLLALVFVGSLIDRKGLGVLLDALGGLGDSRWQLLVIGTGEREAAYRGNVSERGFQDRVRFLGALTEGEVERVLCASDVLVLPSFMEGMPYVILEAMACSLPVIATHVDGIPEATPDGDSALLVPPGDAIALGDAIRRVADDEPLRTELGRRGRRRFDLLFTLDRHIARMESIYLELVTGVRLGGRRS